MTNSVAPSGLGAGTGAYSRLNQVFERTVRFSLATWDDDLRALDVYLRVPGLTERRLHHLPEWTQRAHERLLADHVQQLHGRDDTEPTVDPITARLDHLQRPRAIEPTAAAAPSRAIGR
jgi:hypothetical protein